MFSSSKVFKQSDDRRCAFLRDDNLCKLCFEYGEDALCKTCHLYPRHIEEFDGVREYSLSLSCPEEASKIVNRENILYFTESQDDAEEEYPDDYEEYFDDINEAERIYYIHEELEEAGLSIDVLQMEAGVLYATLRNAGLEPQDYEEFFLDYKETEKQYIMTYVLGQDGIMPIDMDDVDDDTLYEALEEADINPFDYIEYFDDIYEASRRYILFRELEEHGLDKSILYELGDIELYQVLSDAELNPSDYDVFFFNYDGIERIFMGD